LNADGSGLSQLAGTTGGSRPSWSLDAQSIAFGSGGSIRWARLDGSSRGVIIDDGHSPAWRR